MTYWFKNVDESIFEYFLEFSFKEDGALNVGFLVPQLTSISFGFGPYMSGAVIYSCNYQMVGVCKKFWSAAHERPTPNEVTEGTFKFTAYLTDQKDIYGRVLARFDVWRTIQPVTTFQDMMIEPVS